MLFVRRSGSGRLTSWGAPVYVFVGTVILADRWFQYVPGTIIGIVGVGYIVLEYIPSIEPPANMRDADAGWGAEQV